jgi:uncharacterized membrane protein YbhN (UPF0104 family)
MTSGGVTVAGAEQDVRAAESALDAETSHSRLQVARRAAIFVAVAAVVAVALATLPSIGEVRERLTSAQTSWVLIAGLCSLASMLSFSGALWAAFERVLPWRGAVDLGIAEQGANVLLPAGGAGGPAFGAMVMRRAGVPAELAAARHVALFLITSAVSFAALVVMGFGEAAGVLPGEASPAGALAPAISGVLVLAGGLWFATRRPPPPAGHGRVRETVGRLRRFLHGGAGTATALLRRRDAALIGGAVGYYAFDVAALGAAFHAFGGPSLPVGVFVLAYTLGHAGAFVPTPGGVGGTEGGLIGMFVLYGAPIGLATAAVLGYRVFQLGLPALLGAIALARIQRRVASEEVRRQIAARFRGMGPGSA